MNVVYYTQHWRDYFWVEPIWEETGGSFVSELPEISALFAEQAPNVPFHALSTPRRVTLGRAIGDRRLAVKNKATRLHLSLIARALKPDVIVTTSNHRHAMKKDSSRLVKQVQAFHGVSSKNVKFNPWMSDFDLLLLPGKRERDKFEKIGVLDQTQYALIGHPKSDRVLRGELSQQQARARYGLPSDKLTVLYAPTHGALSSFFSWGLEICKSVPPECNLIVKPHPVLATTTAAEGAGSEVVEDVQNYLERRGAQNKNTLWLPLEPDVVPLMAASDVLLTDYSSVAEEYLVFDRPLIFCDHLANAAGRDRAQRDKGDWDELFSVGARVTEANTLSKTIEGALSDASTHSAARRALRDYVFENLDGHCAARAANAIRALAGE
jgi:hypothetical protein